MGHCGRLCPFRITGSKSVTHNQVKKKKAVRYLAYTPLILSNLKLCVFKQCHSVIITVILIIIMILIPGSDITEMCSSTWYVYLLCCFNAWCLYTTIYTPRNEVNSVNRGHFAAQSNKQNLVKVTFIPDTGFIQVLFPHRCVSEGILFWGACVGVWTVLRQKYILRMYNVTQLENARKGGWAPRLLYDYFWLLRMVVVVCTKSDQSQNRLLFIVVHNDFSWCNSAWLNDSLGSLFWWPRFSRSRTGRCRGTK